MMESDPVGCFFYVYGAVIAVVDEVTKILIEGRHCSVTDIGLNLLGVAIGAVVILLVSAISAR